MPGRTKHSASPKRASSAAASRCTFTACSPRATRIRSDPRRTPIAITTESPTGLNGLNPEGRVYHQPTTALLYTHALERGEGRLAEGGPLCVDTGRFTGRSPKDKFVVEEPGSESRIWWGTVNQPISEERFDGLREKVVAHLEHQDLYVVDAFAGADPAHR